MFFFLNIRFLVMLNLSTALSVISHITYIATLYLQEDIQQQKLKLERVEKERNELRLNTDRLESRVGPFACDNAWWENGVRDC